MLTKRLPRLTGFARIVTALAATLAVTAASASVHLSSDALRQLEHDSGVPWIALGDDPATGTGYYLRPSRAVQPWLATGEDPVHGALRFFTTYRGIFQMVDPAHELKVYGRGGGQSVQAAFFTQVEGGVPVVDTGMSIEFDGDGRINVVEGRFLPHLHGFSTTHALSLAAVKVIARDAMARRFPAVRHPALADSPAPLLCITAVGRTPKLGYQLTVDYGDAPHVMSYVIDANSGAILSELPVPPAP
jgi:hypothetical protein